MRTISAGILIVGDNELMMQDVVARETANQAQENAVNALKSADSAISTAIDATLYANEANKTAAEASESAKNATETAQSAIDAANNAQTAATNAEKTANDAKSLVENANNANVFASIYTSGVFADTDRNALKPTPGEGLKVVCAPGAMMIGGVYKKVGKSTRGFIDNGEDRTEVNLYRLYTETGEIVNMWREVVDLGDLLLSSDDAAELPVRGGGWYDILICKVKFKTGTTQITEDMITDFRADPKYCGFVEEKHDPVRQQLTALIGMLYTNGVLEDGTNPLQSFPIGGMRISVRPGTIVLDGTLYTQETIKTISFGARDTDNIIAVGYRYDRATKTTHELYAENCIEQGTLLIRKNANGENEALPVRNDAVYDVIHTILRIPANAAAITQSMIQDVRHTQAYCGYAKFRMIGM